MHHLIDAIINSAVMRSLPGALLFFNIFDPVSNSSTLGDSVFISSLRQAIEDTSRSSSRKSLFESFPKWSAHVSSTTDRSVMRA